MKEEQATGRSHPCVLLGKGHLTQQHTQEVTLIGEATKGELKGSGYLQEASLTHSLNIEDFPTSHLLRHCGCAYSCPP